jgi:hypothetical protein
LILPVLPTSFYPAAILAVFGTIFTLHRLHDHGFGRLVLLSTDFGMVIILPFAIIVVASSEPLLAESLFLSSILFYLAVLVCELLFPNMSRRLSHPIATSYLVFAIVLLLPTLLTNGLESGLVLFGYELSDNITLAAVVCFFIAAMAPPYKQLRFKLKNLSLRHAENAHRNLILSATNTFDLPTTRAPESGENALPSHPLKYCRKLIKEEDYESCVEFCDMEIERFIISKLLQFYPSEVNEPLTIGQQLSMLSSKGISLDEKSITHLRRLRNTIAISSGHATYRKAKWAVHVLRSTMKPRTGLGKGAFTQ